MMKATRTKIGNILEWRFQIPETGEILLWQGSTSLDWWSEISIRDSERIKVDSQGNHWYLYFDNDTIVKFVNDPDQTVDLAAARTKIKTILREYNFMGIIIIGSPGKTVFGDTLDAEWSCIRYDGPHLRMLTKPGSEEDQERLRKTVGAMNMMHAAIGDYNELFEKLNRIFERHAEIIHTTPIVEYEDANGNPMDKEPTDREIMQNVFAELSNEENWYNVESLFDINKPSEEQDVVIKVSTVMDIFKRNLPELGEQKNG